MFKYIADSNDSTLRAYDDHITNVTGYFVPSLWLFLIDGNFGKISSFALEISKYSLSACSATTFSILPCIELLLPVNRWYGAEYQYNINSSRSEASRPS